MDCACILVVGPPRSGSSCVAGVLHHLGVRMSLGSFLPRDRFNVCGYYEDHRLNHILGMCSQPQPDSRRMILATHKWLNDRRDSLSVLHDAIRERCDPAVTWGAKSFLLAMVLPCVIAACSMPVKIIRSIRDGNDVRASSERCGGHRLWNDQYDYALTTALANTEVPVLDVEFQALLSNPATGVDRLAGFIGCEPTQAAVEIIDSSLRTIR